MGAKKFKINDRVRVIANGPYYFHRGQVLDYELSLYKVRIPMIGVRWFRVDELEPVERRS